MNTIGASVQLFAISTFVVPAPTVFNVKAFVSFAASRAFAYTLIKVPVASVRIKYVTPISICGVVLGILATTAFINRAAEIKFAATGLVKVN